MTAFIFILLIIAIVFVFAPVAQAYAQRLNPPDVQGVKPDEIARLREELELLSAHVSRLQEEQSFMLRLLSQEAPRRALEEGSPRPEPNRPRPRDREA
jgi:hypothetical protein